MRQKELAEEEAQRGHERERERERAQRHPDRNTSPSCGSESLQNANILDFTGWRRRFLASYSAHSSVHDDADIALISEAWDSFRTAPNAQQWVKDSNGKRFKMSDLRLFGVGGPAASAARRPVVQPDERVHTEMRPP
jgi:hypothetical protein